MELNWKNKIVPKSPIEQPRRHQKVFFPLLFQVCLQCQWNCRFLLFGGLIAEYVHFF